MTMANKLKGAALQPDATIGSVVEGLSGAEEYVRNVFLGMSKHRDWRVRIATAWGGGAPDYLFDELTFNAVGPERPVTTGMFSGSTHRRLPDARANIASWSTASMSWLEVQALLGGFRGRDRQWKRVTGHMGSSPGYTAKKIPKSEG